MERGERFAGWQWAGVLLVAAALITMHSPALGALTDSAMAADVQVSAHATGVACAVAMGALGSFVIARRRLRRASPAAAWRPMVTGEAPAQFVAETEPLRDFLCIWRL